MIAITACSCVGLLGAGLGGGTGRLQGLHGLITDNIAAAKVVLATGDLIEVSPTSNADLYWGLRGAGHNFGIVAEFNYTVHDLVPNGGSWWWGQYTYTGASVEAVAEAVNNATQFQLPGLSIFVEYYWPSPNATEVSVSIETELSSG
jgi:FAD/FMN-containing dehydrogenase